VLRVETRQVYIALLFESAYAIRLLKCYLLLLFLLFVGIIVLHVFLVLVIALTHDCEIFIYCAASHHPVQNTVSFIMYVVDPVSVHFSTGADCLA
jgi:hypothetical protein